MAKKTKVKSIVDIPPLTGLMDEGVSKVAKHEINVWNKRLFKKYPEYDRFPLSPSQIGKCGLALARNLAHYTGMANYPKHEDDLPPRLFRIFKRGHLLESALIDDFKEYTDIKIVHQQTEVAMFEVGKHTIKGSIDAIGVYPDGTTFLMDFKSKGAFYSASFGDSIGQFFSELQQTGLVEELSENAYLITDVYALFKIVSLDDFFADYLLQLNSYAFAEKFKKPGSKTFLPMSKDPILKNGLDFVCLYYENKNTCANYEVRWKPDKRLFDFARDKFNFIHDKTVKHVKKGDVELRLQIPGEFQLGSTRCKLCEWNKLCHGEFDPSTKVSKYNAGKLPEDLDTDLVEVMKDVAMSTRIEEDVLTYMAKHEMTHIHTSDGLCYERWQGMNKGTPYYKLKLSRKVK